MISTKSLLVIGGTLVSSLAGIGVGAKFLSTKDQKTKINQQDTKKPFVDLIDTSKISLEYVNTYGEGRKNCTPPEVDKDFILTSSEEENDQLDVFEQTCKTIWSSEINDDSQEHKLWIRVRESKIKKWSQEQKDLSAEDNLNLQTYKFLENKLKDSVNNELTVWYFQNRCNELERKEDWIHFQCPLRKQY